MSRFPILLASTTLLFAGLAQAAEPQPATPAPQAPSASQPPASRYAARLRGPAAEMERYDKPAEAEQFYWRKRSPDGVTPVAPERYLEAAKVMSAMPQRSSVARQSLPPRAAGGGSGAVSLLQAESTTSTWEPLGPGNIGGRTRALVVDPRHPRVMFAAGVAGGVWKSNDAGRSWRPIADFLPNIAVNSLAIAPTNSNILYAGTGEGYFNIDGARGAGIFKTTDAGATWTRLAATATRDFYYVNDLVVSSTTPNRVYAATDTGVWRSTNGGQTWTRVLKANPLAFGGCLDLAIRTDRRSDFVFAS